MKTARILVLTYGTRGDVEPFVALGLGLRQAGYHPVLATPARFGSWIESCGLMHAPLPDTSLDLMHSADGRTVLAGRAGVLRRLAAARRLAREAAPVNAVLYREAWQVARESRPELIVFHPKLLAAPHLAEALAIPAIMAALQPMLVPTAAFPASGMPHWQLPGYNRMSYQLVTMSLGAFRTSINRLRRNTLNLAPIRAAREVLLPPGAGTIRLLHAISSAVVPRPDDWPAEALMSGYWPLPPAEDFVPPPALQAFLAAGERPVFIGFGSMLAEDPKALSELVLEATRRAGVRGVIASGWAGLALKADHVITVHDVPHAWLFPQMAAVVHHGGAGTAAAGFRAGVPSVICPFFGDQSSWAWRSVALGVGAPPVPRRRLRADRLAASIRRAVSDAAMRLRARQLSAALAAEDGIARAITAIGRSL